MEMYISINNREKVFLMPYLPSEITVGNPQGNEVYNTVNGELNLIGSKGLATISFSSWVDSWELITALNQLRNRKLPFRLIITDSPINVAVTIDNLEYSMRHGKKIYYTLELKEFRFGGVK